MALLPLSLPGQNEMPMGQLGKLPLDTRSLIAGQPQSAPAPMPPPSAAGMVAAPSGVPIGATSVPDAPAKPPYDVVLQDDGSSVYQLPATSPGGKPIVLAVNKPPPVPKALQSTTPATLAQG